MSVIVIIIDVYFIVTIFLLQIFQIVYFNNCTINKFVLENIYQIKLVNCMKFHKKKQIPHSMKYPIKTHYKSVSH